MLRGGTSRGLYFESHDLPTDPAKGFLPPNDDTGRGEGFLSYQAKAKPGLATGTVIDARASIVFDSQDPVDTPAIFPMRCRC